MCLPGVVVGGGGEVLCENCVTGIQSYNTIVVQHKPDNTIGRVFKYCNQIIIICQTGIFGPMGPA